jgi:hypothetical protein
MSLYIKLSQVVSMTDRSSATIYRYMKADNFPQPYILGANAVRWKEEEVIQWLENLPRRNNRRSVK